MSLKSQRTAICDECGSEFEITVYDSVSATGETELKKKIFNSELFTFQCPYCGHIQFINYPIYYHNKKRKFMVFQNDIDNLYAEKELTNPELVKAFNLKGNYTYWGTTSYIDFVTKITALENGYDPRATELMIYQYKAILYKELYNKTGVIADIKNAGLVPSKNGGVLVSIAYNSEVLNVPFDAEFYAAILESNAYKRISNLNMYVFDEEAMEKFFEEFDEPLEKALRARRVFCIVKDDDGTDTVCHIPKKLKLTEGDYVCYKDHDYTKTGLIEKIFEINPYEYPRKDYLFIIGKTENEMDFIR